MICHKKVHIVSYNLDQKKFSKSKIHILPIYEQTDLKTAIVICLQRKGKYVRMTLHVEVEVNSKNPSPLKIELMCKTGNYNYGFKSLKRD